MNSYFCIDTRAIEPGRADCTNVFCKCLRDPDKKQLLIVDAMSEDIVAGITSVSDIDALSTRMGMFAEKYSKSFFFVHIMDSLKLYIKEDII